LVLLENLQDPGNLGTILRTGEGAGITGVIMSGGTVDIYNPKVIRATMGSIFRVPFIYVERLTDVFGQLGEKGIRIYAAHLDGKNYYDSFSFAGGTAFLIGNEGNGLERETADRADAYLKIPMEGRVESLNAAVAASLLMYEAHRQRMAGKRETQMHA
jgi:TrmH family RNA methyltransferase